MIKPRVLNMEEVEAVAKDIERRGESVAFNDVSLLDLIATIRELSDIVEDFMVRGCACYDNITYATKSGHFEDCDKVMARAEAVVGKGAE